MLAFVRGLKSWPYETGGVLVLWLEADTISGMLVGVAADGVSAGCASPVCTPGTGDTPRDAKISFCWFWSVVRAQGEVEE